MAFYLTSILTFFMAFYLASILTFFMAFCLAIYSDILSGILFEAGDMVFGSRRDPPHPALAISCFGLLRLAGRSEGVAPVTGIPSIIIITCC